VERLLEPFSFDPVPDPEGEVTNDARVVHMANGGMVQPAERLGLSQKPRAYGGVAVKVHPQADSPFEDQVISLKQHLFGRRRDSPFQTVALSQSFLGTLEVAERLDGGQRSSPRRRSTLTSRPQSATLHQRRL
jgi:hypothetical protein